MKARALAGANTGINTAIKTTLKIALTSTSLIFCETLMAANWHCEVKESFGKQSPTSRTLSLSIKDRHASLGMPGFSYTSGTLNEYGGHYDFAEQDISSLENERVSSSRMFRFDSNQGKLIFFDHNNKHQLIVGECTLKPQH